LAGCPRSTSCSFAIFLRTNRSDQGFPIKADPASSRRQRLKFATNRDSAAPSTNNHCLAPPLPTLDQRSSRFVIPRPPPIVGDHQTHLVRTFKRLIASLPRRSWLFLGNYGRSPAQHMANALAAGPARFHRPFGSHHQLPAWSSSLSVPPPLRPTRETWWAYDKIPLNRFHIWKTGGNKLFVGGPAFAQAAHKHPIGSTTILNQNILPIDDDRHPALPSLPTYHKFFSVTGVVDDEFDGAALLRFFPRNMLRGNLHRCASAPYTVTLGSRRSASKDLIAPRTTSTRAASFGVEGYRHQRRRHDSAHSGGYSIGLGQGPQSRLRLGRAANQHRAPSPPLANRRQRWPVRRQTHTIPSTRKTRAASSWMGMNRLDQGTLYPGCCVGHRAPPKGSFGT